MQMKPIRLTVTPYEGELLHAVFEGTNLPLLREYRPELESLINRLMSEIQNQLKSEDSAQIQGSNSSEK
jgi:hypothetical protein